MIETRRSANINDIYPWITSPSGERSCAYCRKPMKHKGMKYCSRACRDEVYIQLDPGFARQKVGRRDSGVCSMCGCDTKKLERILRRVRWAVREPVKRELGFDSRMHYWEMDHIIPVIEGGGLCGLDNLRTLCLPCHKSRKAKPDPPKEIKNNE